MTRIERARDRKRHQILKQLLEDRRGEIQSKLRSLRETLPAEVAEVMKKIRSQPVLHVGVQGDMAAAGQLLESMENVDRIEQRNGLLRVTLVTDQPDYSNLPTALVQAGYRLTLFHEEKINLETAFMRLTKGIVQ